MFTKERTAEMAEAIARGEACPACRIPWTPMLGSSRARQLIHKKGCEYLESLLIWDLRPEEAALEEEGTIVTESLPDGRQRWKMASKDEGRSWYFVQWNKEGAPVLNRLPDDLVEKVEIVGTTENNWLGQIIFNPTGGN